MKRLSDAIADDEDQLEITPLIDVIFMLLLFFIVTTTFAEDTFFPIELPTARNAAPAEILDLSSTVVIEISANGELAMEKTFVPSSTALFQRLQTLATTRRVQAVAIKADADSPAQITVDVLDVLRELGIERFAITTKP